MNPKGNKMNTQMGANKSKETIILSTCFALKTNRQMSRQTYIYLSQIYAQRNKPEALVEDIDIHRKSDP